MWSSHSIDCDLAQRQIGPWRSLLASLPGRSAVIRRIGESSPRCRTRTAGPVGPDLDYSVWFSRILMDRDVHGKMKEDLKKIFASAGDTPRRDFTVHHGLETVHANERQIRLWTEYAIKHGIRFSGEWGYIFPGKRSRAKWAKADFVLAKDAGLVPQAKRSREAAMRRAAKRRQSRKDPARKGASAPPLEVEVPLVWRMDRSARSLRNDWRVTAPGMTWSAYRFRQVVEPVLVVSIQKRPVPASRPVIDAINRIYSRKELVPAFVKQPKVVVPKGRPLANFIPGPPLVEQLRDSLRKIEDEGFRDPYRWFNLNHALTKALASNAG